MFYTFDLGRIHISPGSTTCFTQVKNVFDQGQKIKKDGMFIVETPILINKSLTILYQKTGGARRLSSPLSGSL